MNAQLTHEEIDSARELLQEYQPANKAIDAIERHNGNLETSFEELWIEKNGTSTIQEKKSLWQITLEVLREEICSDEGFRARLGEYTKSPENAVLLTTVITSLIALTAIPIDPSIATIIILYILKIGLNVYCKYTDPDNQGVNLAPAT
ncbi:hypothetical protein NIES4101_82930 [Calothrix sp. NIES-4101]|nr:hypothetical protein NIES4101_82930 [Calothrix sp. NIES-4101]